MASRKINADISKDIKDLKGSLAGTFSKGSTKSPGGRKSRKTAQYSTKLSRKDQSNLKRVASQELLKKTFRQNSGRIEVAVNDAMMQVIAGLVGALDSVDIKVLGRSIGSVRPTIDLDVSPLGKFIKSKEGAGEIGLPDPNESMRQLKHALTNAITPRVVIRPVGPRVRFSFNQNRLLKGTPHPSRNSAAPFSSWLELVTGPDFISGISDVEFVTVAQMKDVLKKEKRSPRGLVKRNFGMADAKPRSSGLSRFIKAPRSIGFAGNSAGLMLSIQKRGLRLSTAEFAGGKGRPYRTSSNLEGFWDTWWEQVKVDLKRWTALVNRAVIRQIINRG